jgi:hypothetical protein
MPFAIALRGGTNGFVPHFELGFLRPQPSQFDLPLRDFDGLIELIKLSGLTGGADASGQDRLAQLSR